MKSKMIFITIGILGVGLALHATENMNKQTETLNATVNAPVIYDRTTVVNAEAGQIVYDSASPGGFYGLKPSSDPTSSNSWIQMGGSTTGSPLITPSSSSELLARANVDACGSNPCSSYSQSGTWISSISRTSAGFYVISFNGSPFGANTPTCITQLIDGSNASGHSQIWAVSSSSVSVRFWSSTNAAYDPSNGFGIICTR